MFTKTQRTVISDCWAFFLVSNSVFTPQKM